MSVPTINQTQLNQHIASLERIKRLGRRAERLRQINSNKAFRMRNGSIILSIVTVAVGSAVTFASFIDEGILRAGLPFLNKFQSGGITFFLDILILAIVILSIAALILRFGERAAQHNFAIEKLTSFILQNELLREEATSGVRTLTLKDAARENERYLNLVITLPPTTDKEFFRAKKDLEKKRTGNSTRKIQDFVFSSRKQASLSKKTKKILRRSRNVMACLDAMQKVQVGQELWLCGGTIRDTIWGTKCHTKDVPFSDDIDVIYYDSSNTSKDEEVRIQSELKKFLCRNWQVKNEARLSSARTLEQAIAMFPETCNAIAVRLDSDDIYIIAPYGLSDVFSLIVRQSPAALSEEFKKRLAAKKWDSLWPRVMVIDTSLEI